MTKGHCHRDHMISIMVSWMYNNAKDVKTAIDNTLYAFTLNWKTVMQWHKEQKSQGVFHWNFQLCPIFDTTTNRDPLQFRVGEGQIISRFEQATIGMEPGESKMIEVPADEAYGPHHKALVLTVDRNIFSEDAQPEVGRQFEIRQPYSQTIIAMVTDVTESSATSDANHPLAGKDLIFEVQLLEIV